MLNKLDTWGPVLYGEKYETLLHKRTSMEEMNWVAVKRDVNNWVIDANLYIPPDLAKFYS